MKMIDHPIDGSKEKPDLFHRKDFSTRIAKLLLLPIESDSLVVSLEGGWGMGKTSVIEMMCRYYESMQENNRPMVIKFNPWMFSGLGNLAKEFLVQFGSSLGIKDKGKNLKSAGKALLKYSQFFDLIKFIPGSEPVTSIIKTTGNALEQTGELKELNIQQQRGKVIEALRDTEKNFVVIIDDLDRLVPEEIYTILRLVKTVSDFPRVAFLLAYEHSHVEESLLKCNLPDASGYLEKIIQIRLSLPRISQSDALNFLDVSLKGFGESIHESEFPDEQQRWQKCAHKHILPLLDSPRDFIRLSNRLKFNYSLVEGELVFSDYCCLEVLAVVAPKVYDHIKDHPLAYIGSDPQDLFSLRRDAVESLRNSRTKILESVENENKRRLISRLIEELFPLTRADKINNFDNSSVPTRSSGRISNPDNFEFAFYFSRPHHLVELRDLRKLWKEPDSRAKTFADLASGDRAKKVLDAIDELIFNPESKHSTQEWGLPADEINFVENYVKFIDNTNLPNRIGGIFSGDYRTLLSRMIYWMLKRNTEAKRKIEFARSLCINEATIPAGCELVRENLSEHGYFEDSKKSNNPVFPFKLAKEINLQWKQTCTGATRKKRFWQFRLLRDTFTTLLHLEGKEIIQSAFERKSLTILEKYKGLFALLGEGSINGEPYLTAQKWTFERLDIKLFQKMASNLKKPKSVSQNEFKALQLAFRTPGNSYFVATAEKTR